MRIKERIIRQAISEAETEVKKIDGILNANPLSDLIRLERETIETAKKMPNKEALVFIGKQIKERDRLLRLAKKQQQSLSLIDRKVKLQFELRDLINELYWIDQRSGVKGVE